MHTIAEVKDHFAAGAESATLTRAEWQSIIDVVDSYCATGLEASRAKAEAERVKRIARPLWRACKSVARQIRGCGGSPSLWHLREWEMRLRHATEVDWRDLPPDRRAAAAPRSR
jgi:hypothetical protein